MQPPDLVGVAGFEPAASWTRTMRDTKLRHTPIDRNIIMIISNIVKSLEENTRNSWEDIKIFFWCLFFLAVYSPD